MQIRQRMDLDQTNETNNCPTKPLLLNKKNNKNKIKKRKNRAFGVDITNQSRQNKNVVQINEKTTTKTNVNTKVKEIEIEIEIEKKSKEDPEDNDTNINNNNDIICDVGLAIWDDVDIDNDLFVTDYIGDIMTNLRLDEDLNRDGCIIENNKDFMSEQQDVNARMRTVLVDWLVEVHRKFKLLPCTYFLAINLLDRYLSKRQLHRRKLQLCGCTCLWIASKYHEIYAPEMDDFIYISDNAFRDCDLMSMEIEILKTLSFTLTVPTVYNYSQRYTKISSYYLKKKKEMKIITDLIMYCIEHCVMSYKLCRMTPSLISAAAFVYSCLSTKVFSIETFENDNIAQVIGYKLTELTSVMKDIDNIVSNAKKGKHKAVFNKYCNSKYSNIGKLNFAKLNTTFLNQT